jgi:hypothetical protein
MSNSERFWYLVLALFLCVLAGALHAGMFWVWADYIGWSPYIFCFLQGSSNLANRFLRRFEKENKRR